MIMARERFFGEPQNLDALKSEHFTPSNAFIQRMREVDGAYGAVLGKVLDQDVFLYCEELLGLALFVQRYWSWIEEHAQANREWFGNEVAGRIVRVQLRNKHSPDTRAVISLATENHFAWYGTLVPPETPEQRFPKGDLNPQEFLRSEWDEEGPIPYLSENVR
ncbi:MAG TPA: hypothetical protein VFV38_30420 [Ktedonobacteraceae bacterium]|nr:hypothetical protein [Ktedonobacteraceae bacterium]